MKWFIEGDIRGCFDNIDHEVLLGIVAEDIHDNRFIRLLKNLLGAGYLEQWQYEEALSGAPQGGIINPLLSGVYLDRLDRLVESTLLPAYNRGERRRNDPELKALLRAAGRAGDEGEHEEARRPRKQAQAMPSCDPNDPDFRRLWYVRHADDFPLRFSGPRHEAEEIERRIGDSLRDALRVKMSDEKTLVTHDPHGRGEVPRLRGRGSRRGRQARPPRSTLHQRRRATEGSGSCRQGEVPTMHASRQARAPTRAAER